MNEELYIQGKCVWLSAYSSISEQQQGHASKGSYRNDKRQYTMPGFVLIKYLLLSRLRSQSPSSRCRRRMTQRPTRLCSQTTCFHSSPAPRTVSLPNAASHGALPGLACTPGTRATLDWPVVQDDMCDLHLISFPAIGFCVACHPPPICARV